MRVPKYANPTGNTYSPETVKAMAELPNAAAADDFVVLWDNAYAVHHLQQPGEQLSQYSRRGCNRSYQRAHRAICLDLQNHLAGGGVGFVSAASDVLKSLSAHLSVQTVGPDKVNQLRHARF